MALLRPSFFLLSILILYLFSPVHVEGAETKQEISCTCTEPWDGNKCKSEADKACTDCDLAVTITRSADGKTFNFKIKADKPPKEGITKKPYFALALSKDDKMAGSGNDAALICSEEFGQKPKTFLIEGKSPPTAKLFTKGGPIDGGFDTKTCSFTLESNLQMGDDKFDLNKDVTHILLSRGDSDGNGGVSPHGGHNMCVTKFNLASALDDSGPGPGPDTNKTVGLAADTTSTTTSPDSNSTTSDGRLSLVVSKFGLFFAFFPSVLTAAQAIYHF